MLWIYTGNELIHAEAVIKEGSTLRFFVSGRTCEKTYSCTEAAQSELERILKQLDYTLEDNKRGVIVRLDM